MNQHLIELHLQRGRLIERIAMQRDTLARQLVPVSAALGVSDRAIAVARDSVRYVRQHPAGVAALVAVTVVLRPRVVWRWLRRGFVVWRSWRAFFQFATEWRTRRRG